mmetsp:Transcript_364/g.820  ORF Transcript_364/g.820 Transcript_364/m.820 type:complete len:466 (-) Transcript_364:79-1476(-)
MEADPLKKLNNISSCRPSAEVESLISSWFRAQPEAHKKILEILSEHGLPNWSTLRRIVNDRELLCLFPIGFRNHVKVAIAQRSPGQLDLHLAAPEPQGQRSLEADTCVLQVLEAAQLAALDIGGKSDPYAVVLYNGEKVGQSPTVSTSLDPIWGYEIKLPIPPLLLSCDGGPPKCPHTITIEIWDKDTLTPDELIGKVETCAHSVKENGLVDAWLPLTPEGSGQVHLRFYMTSFKERLHPPLSLSAAGLEFEDDTKWYYDHFYFDDLQTGDLVAFCGCGLLSKVIRRFCGSLYSHVGSIVRMPDPKDGYRETVFVVESMIGGDYEVDYFEEKGGVDGINIYKLHDRLKVYPGEAIYWIRLKEPLMDEEKKKFRDFALNHRAKKTKFDISQMFGAGLNPFGNTEDAERFYCAEFASFAYREVNRLPPDINPSRQTAQDVANLPIWKAPRLPLMVMKATADLGLQMR